MTGINTNVGAILATAYAQKSKAEMQTSFERLSSGLQVNSAADNAAGLAVSNKMASQIRGITTALNNTADGISLVNAALSGMETSLAVSQRMRELALQSHSGVYTDSDRQNMQAEVSSLLGELGRIAGQTTFNQVELLDGTYEHDMRVGNSNAEIVNVTIENMGINKTITGTTSATGLSTTILRPTDTGSGTSSFLTPVLSRASGASTPVFLSTSSATGTSTFNVAGTSTAGGVSVLDVLATDTATGTSNFNTPATSTASGSSSLNILSSTIASGTSAFNTPSQVTATGTSSLDVLASASGVSINSTDSPSSSTAQGTSRRVLLANSSATGTSSLDLLSSLAATAGTSTLSNLLPESFASEDSGGASTLTPLAYKNSDFSQGTGSQTYSNTTGTVSISGWDIHLEQIALNPGTSSVSHTIAGYATPFDSVQPGNSPGDDTPVTGYNGNSVDYSYSVGSNSLTLSINDVSTSAFGQVHGPYVVSENSLLLDYGDTISFDWQGIGAGDAADVYGYLLDVDDGTTIELVNYTHNSFGTTPVFSVSETINRSGNYKFVFIAGSYDDNGGGRVGSSVSLSNLAITQVSPSTARLTTAEVTLSATEASQVKIKKQRFAQMMNFVTTDPGTGTFSILSTGTDHSKFSVDQQGNVASTVPLLYASQTSYEFDVQYVASTGKTHIETVTLNLNASNGARTDFTVQEANALTISLSELTRMNQYVSNNAGGSFRMSPAGTDSALFSIDASSGLISATGPIDFDTQNRFDFTVIYEDAMGFEFSNQIVLDITDTLTSTATLSAQESLDVLIDASLFTSSIAYAAKEDSGAGNFSLSGTDASSFYFDGANIRSTGPLRLAEKSSYSFDYVYTASNGNVHTEAVSLNLTESLQSTATLFANPSGAVSINRTTLTKLNDFALRDSLAGTFSLSANAADSDDYLLFSIDGSGNVTSSGALNYATQPQYNFDVVYTASDGTVYRESIVLNLVDPAAPITTIRAEENQSLTIAAAQFTATAAAATSNPGGTYRLAGTDASLLSIDSSGNVSAPSGLLVGASGTYNHKRTLDFEVEYLVGGIVNSTETVKLEITEALQSTASFTAHESDEVIIEAASLEKIYDFAARHRFGGSWGINNAAFTIDSLTGQVRSASALDFDTLATHTFDVTYTLQNGTVFTEAVTLNLTDTFTSAASLTTEETQALTIRAGTLSSTAAFAAKDSYAGAFSLTGTDASLFSIDSTGEVTSTGALLRSNKSSFSFNVLYTSSGGDTHTEAVTLTLSEALQSDSAMAAVESGRVDILLDRLTEISGFSSRDGANGTFQIAATGSDYSKFSISANGNISSVGALDFDTQSAYTFDVLYIASDSRTFSDTVTLTLSDTLSSSATLTAEETDALTVPAAVLSSTNTYASKDSFGGTFSLTGADAALFDINSSGVVTSRSGLRHSTQASYAFNVVYAATSGDVHTESVQLNLTQALQADASLSAVESNQLVIERASLTSLDDFAASDSYAGSYQLVSNSIDAGDYAQFTIDSFGRIQATGNLDYTDETQFHFDVTYTASDSRVFTERVVLDLTDTLSSSAQLAAEESDQVILSLSQLTSTADFAARHTGGTYSLATSGFDNHLFSLSGSNIVANQAFRKDTKAQYELDLLYDVGGMQHREHITLDLTRFLQSQTSLSTQEASGAVIVNSNVLTHMFDFTNDESMAGSFRLTGGDAGLFSINAVGDIVSNTGLEFDTQQTYSFTTEFIHTDGRTFSDTTSLSITDTFAGLTTVTAEEAVEVVIDSTTLSSLISYAAKDGNAGSFSLDAIGNDYAKFSIDANGTLRSTQELRYEDQQTFELKVRYNGVGIGDYVETVQLSLTPTTYGHTRSLFTSKEAGEIIIVPQLNPFMKAYAEADNFQGHFEIAQSPHATQLDHYLFAVDAQGEVRSTQIIDFESGRTSFEILLYYQHSNGTDRFSDFMRLDITNDKRDDNNLALEDIDISTREAAREAALLLEEVVVKVSAAQAQLGAIQNRFQHNLDNLSMALLMVGKAQGRIIDADFARETSQLAKTRILNQASTAMIANATDAQKQVLMLLD